MAFALAPTDRTLVYACQGSPVNHREGRARPRKREGPAAREARRMEAVIPFALQTALVSPDYLRPRDENGRERAIESAKRKRGLRAGRGLKPWWRNSLEFRGRVAPGLRAGRGLKLTAPGNLTISAAGSARPSGWARIETVARKSHDFRHPRSAGLLMGRLHVAPEGRKGRHRRQRSAVVSPSGGGRRCRRTRTPAGATRRAGRTRTRPTGRPDRRRRASGRVPGRLGTSPAASREPVPTAPPTTPTTAAPAATASAADPTCREPPAAPCPATPAVAGQSPSASGPAPINRESAKASGRKSSQNLRQRGPPTQGPPRGRAGPREIAAADARTANRLGRRSNPQPTHDPRQTGDAGQRHRRPAAAATAGRRAGLAGKHHRPQRQQPRRLARPEPTRVPGPTQHPADCAGRHPQPQGDLGLRVARLELWIFQLSSSEIMAASGGRGPGARGQGFGGWGPGVGGRESPGKNDVLPKVAAKNRHHASNRSQGRTLRQESLRKNDVGSSNAGRNDTRGPGRRGFRPASHNTRKIALLT